MNENFDPTCWYITYNYRKDARPKNREELTEHARKLLRELRKRYKKAGKCLKYVWVPEVGPRGGSHIHIVISSIDLNLISDVWAHGGMYIEPLRSDRNYRKLAEYFVEYSEKTRRELGGKQIRYNPSRNLVRVPMEERKKRKKTFSADQIEVPEGWYLDKESVREWVNEFGYKYLYYLLVRTKPWKVKDG